MTAHTILWRRLDAAGHDACRLTPQDEGWRLNGVAVFQHEAGPACVEYDVRCDAAWLTCDGRIRGWLGTKILDARIARGADNIWSLNGGRQDGLQGCVDLDLGFTPATNLFQLRRVALHVGHAADVPVAWFDVESAALERVDQRYARRSEQGYWYESRRFGYSALLEVSAAGFVRKYPELWEAECEQ